MYTLSCSYLLIIFHTNYSFFHLLYSVGLHTKAELEAMVDRMESSDLHTINLTDNDLVKDHLRHLVLLTSDSGFYCCIFMK